MPDADQLMSADPKDLVDALASARSRGLSRDDIGRPIADRHCWRIGIGRHQLRDD
jgi:hypothetical protein